MDTVAPRITDSFPVPGASLDDQPSAPGIVVSLPAATRMIFLPVPAVRHDVKWVGFFRSERRVRERAVPVVWAARAGAVRAALVTTSLWQRGGCNPMPGT